MSGCWKKYSHWVAVELDASTASTRSANQNLNHILDEHYKWNWQRRRSIKCNGVERQEGGVWEATWPFSLSSREWKSYCRPPSNLQPFVSPPWCSQVEVEFKIHTNPRLALLESTQTINSAAQSRWFLLQYHDLVSCLQFAQPPIKLRDNMWIPSIIANSLKSLSVMKYNLPKTILTSGMLQHFSAHFFQVWNQNSSRSWSQFW